jgi:flagellar basal-body rod protein FlgB
MPENIRSMDLSQVPLFEALTKRMAWLTERQTVLAQNVANADTPGYVARDLREPDFRKYLMHSTTAVALAATQPGHLSVKETAAAAAVPQKSGDAESGGHAVSLEEQMMKVSQTANDYALVATVYRANLCMVKTVLGRSG